MPRRASATSFGGIAGNPGNKTKAGPGRLPDIFKMRMANLAARNKTAKNVEKILDDPAHPAFMKALEFAADRGFGKAAQAIDLTTGGEKINALLVVPEEQAPS
jgi:hypothetical protein